jgi:two-component system, cell cycle response regulator
MAGERILIVDDEESIRSLLVRVCERAGYRADATGRTSGGIECLGTTFYSVVILDLALPDGNGIEVLREAKRLHEETEVIILTGHGDLQSAVEALRLGAYDYLQKPVLDLQFIHNAITRALERQRLRGHNAQLLHQLQAANAEIELRRRQQLQNIQYIGQALAGALRSEEVAQLLIRALLGLTGCDGAGVYLVQKDGNREPWALVGGRGNLTRQAREALVGAMRHYLQVFPSSASEGAMDPSSVAQTVPSEIAIQDLPGLSSEEIDGDEWRCCEFGLLAVRDDLKGVVVLASHQREPFGEEALGTFGILTLQGSVAMDNAYLFVRTRELAVRDGLTGLYNRRHFYEMLDAEISRSERHGLELSVIMLDIDKGQGFGLKAINDTYGHQAGDEMLRLVARFLQGRIRRADVVARYGGDEFIIMAPQTGREDVLALATRIGEQLAQTLFLMAERGVRLTASIGVAVFQRACGQDADGLVRMADQGLYLAKVQGGNRVCVNGEEVEVAG